MGAISRSEQKKQQRTHDTPENSRIMPHAETSKINVEGGEEIEVGIQGENAVGTMELMEFGEGKHNNGIVRQQFSPQLDSDINIEDWEVEDVVPLQFQ